MLRTKILLQHQSTYLGGHESASIEISDLVEVTLNVKIVKQDLLKRKQFLKWWKENFNWCRFWTSYLGMYFDASAVFITNFLLLLRLALAIAFCGQNLPFCTVLGSLITVGLTWLSPTKNWACNCILASNAPGIFLQWGEFDFLTVIWLCIISKIIAYF